ncbi:hypothetical protein FACS1894132_13010 [Clostridia bacterium]|nr:hypothetical protein FACS1894132_13010 [Clostridia bacterium]
MGFFTKDIGIDLGTANTLVYMPKSFRTPFYSRNFAINTM